MQLAATELGQGNPVVVLHGLFGSGRNWASMAQRLATAHRVLLLDLRNHGASLWADTMTYPEMAEDVRQTVGARGIERYALIGHSMGGKVAMQLALSHAEEVGRLVAADIAPVAYQPRHASYVRAMQALDLTSIQRRGQADEALSVYMRDPAERGFLLQNLVFEGGHQPRWRINLDAIGRGMPSLVAAPLASGGAVYDGPALFVAGANSDFVLPEYEAEIARLFPKAQVKRIPDAGHWLHAEQPQAFLDLVMPFLRNSG